MSKEYKSRTQRIMDAVVNDTQRDVVQSKVRSPTPVPSTSKTDKSISSSEFSEDDDDSVRDPNYTSSSSSNSSSSTSSSSISSSSCSSEDELDKENNKFKANLGERIEKEPENVNNIVEAELRKETENDLENENNKIEAESIEETEKEPDNENNTTEIELVDEIETGPGNGNNIVEETNKNKVKKNTRKRQRNEANYQKTEAKRLRNEGKEYISTSKLKRVISAKKVKNPCGEKCQHKCYTKITEEQRLAIFNDYYCLGNINRKRDYLSKHMELIQPKYRYVRADRQRPERRLNYAFYFHVSEGKKIRVCKTFFKNTLDINDRTILTVRNKTNESGIVSEDMRGKHNKHKKISEDLRNGVRSHINKIPRIESHYLRAQTTKEFIDGSKTIAQLHRDYKVECESQGKQSVNYHMYADIFNNEFNLSFFTPRKDQCNLCFQYTTASEQAKEALKNEYEEHLREKTLSRQEKENDKSQINGAFVLACFDMQAVLQIPKGDINSFYYKSKLNTMNLTVTEVGNDATKCFVWHEGEGGKGATEVGSCILQYLEEKANECDNEDLEIVLYSDNCGAQQKNKFMIAVLMYAVQKFKIKRISHKYLIVGHTQNEGDSTHSVIEKEVARSLKSGPIFAPDQFVMLIRMAKKKGKPYAVNELTHDNFVDVKQLAVDMGPNFIENTEGEKIQLSKMKMVKVEKKHPFAFFYKHSYSDTDWKRVDVRQVKQKKRSSRSEGANNNIQYSETLPRLRKFYKTKLPLNDNKKRDLEYLVNKYVPLFYHNFYRSLF